MEILAALKQMKDNKTPGSNGRTKTFHLHFRNDIHELLTKSYEYSYQKGHLSPEQRRDVIKLIPKKGRDLTYLKNWISISIQNIDSKLLVLVFARGFA